MTTIRPVKSAAFALALIGAAVTPAFMTPSFAGPAETRILEGLVGVWDGRGTIQGAENGTAVCKLTFKPNGEKLSYTGRCSMAGNSTSFRGALIYDEGSKQFVMATSGGGADSQTVAGRRNGNSVVFVTGGNDRRGSYSSTMTLGNSIQMQFGFTDAKTKEKTSANVRFAKG